MLSWDPVPGATSTSSTTPRTRTSPPPRSRPFPPRPTRYVPACDSTTAWPLPETRSGRPTTGTCDPATSGDCGPDPESHITLSDTRAFRKASPPIAGLSSTDPNASEITFSWQDYYDTNQAVTYGGELGNQTAKTYRLQVDNDPSFSTPIDTRIVDQATFTAYDDLYPEGTYFWRVQAATTRTRA